MQNTYEFLLWSNCNFDCPFCWQRRSINKDTIVFEYMRSIPCSQVESFLKFLDNEYESVKKLEEENS